LRAVKTGVAIGAGLAQLPRTTVNPRTLLVEPDADYRTLLAEHLAGRGRDVVAVSSFSEAREQLKLAPFDLIVTATRLGAFNGLHLVLIARSMNMSMAAIVTTPTPDEVLEREASSFGAAFVARPWENLAVLSDAVLRVTQSQPL
jgi:DNA-binding response OmpR family regulator